MQRLIVCHQKLLKAIKNCVELARFGEITFSLQLGKKRKNEANTKGFIQLLNFDF